MPKLEFKPASSFTKKRIKLEFEAILNRYLSLSQNGLTLTILHFLLIGMDNLPKSLLQAPPQENVFSLANLSVSPQKNEYTSPKVKVITSFDLSTYQNLTWFMDIYNFEGVCQEDLHLYVKKDSEKYGDMGVVTNAQEDLNDMAMPCITITTVTNGEYMKATNLSLKLSSWAPFGMTRN